MEACAGTFQVASTRGDGYVQSRTRHSIMMMRIRGSGAKPHRAQGRSLWLKFRGRRPLPWQIGHAGGAPEAKLFHSQRYVRSPGPPSLTLPLYDNDDDDDDDTLTYYKCGPIPNVMVALPNIGGALCSTPQSLADAHYYTCRAVTLPRRGSR